MYTESGMASVSRPPSVTTRISNWARLHKLGAYLLIAPALMLLLFVLMVPLISVVQLSLYKRGPAGTIIRETSLNNYITFLGEPVYLKILANSAVVGIWVCIFAV